ncbi:hypothetical protein [Nocardioides sp.]|uniref:hypothetical protein n=1 Tax=Nocardioides sp. TaxID=35761 RepID=UPI003785024E
MRRALVGLVAAVVVLVGLLAAPASAQQTNTMVRLGQLDPDGVTESTTTCPTGTSVTAAVVGHLDAGGDFVRGLQLTCSDATTTTRAGGTAEDGEVAEPSACQPGDRGTGLGIHWGAVIDALSLRCTGTGDPYEAGYVGGMGGALQDSGDCAAGTELIGLSVWTKPFEGHDAVVSVRGVCAALSGRIGNLAATGTTTSTTECPPGRFATGIVVHTLTTGDYVRGVQLTCTDGSTSEYAGGSVNDGTTSATTSCGPTDLAIGIGGRAGEVLDAVSAWCFDGGLETTPIGSSGGDYLGASICPEGTFLSGLTVWWGEYLDQDTATSFNGLCATPDVTAPVVALDPVPVVTLQGSQGLSWAGSDPAPGTGIDHYELRYRAANLQGTFGPWTYPADWQHLTGTSTTATGLQLGRDYCYSLRAVDLVENASAWSAPSCVARAMDDRALRSLGPWVRATAPRWWNSTATVTRKQGATLTRPAARTTLVALVASTCPTCGAVDVMLGRTKVGHVSLVTRTSRSRQLLLLPTVPPRTAPLTITVTTSGRTVQIDGVVLSPR